MTINNHKNDDKLKKRRKGKKEHLLVQGVRLLKGRCAVGDLSAAAQQRPHTIGGLGLLYPKYIT